MSRFSIKYPYLVIVLCLIVGVVGLSSVVRMPVDLFPPINIPVVVVATFYSGMPPEQIENDITGTYERFFTLASGINHIESRSLPGISLIKIYFEAGTNADSDVTSITNLAMANLRRLPPGTLPPVVLKFDASSLPVCLVTLKGAGLNETQLHDVGQYNVRNQIASVPGCAIPPPFGGRLRQIQIYLDPVKMEARQLSLMDVVHTVNDANLILPAGDVKIGPFDYNLYTNSQLATMDDINHLPLKMFHGAPVLVADVGKAVDDAAIQTNVVRIDGQRSVYLPILKSSAEANTIAVVSGIKEAIRHLLDIPKSLVTTVVFDQSVFVKTAINNLVHEGVIGLVLTGLMILIFLGNVRATFAVFLSIPLSLLATFIALQFGGSSINAMILGGLALALSRLIDNSVIVLENIFRHMEMGESPAVAAERGGEEVALAVLAATLTTAIVFFPVTFLAGVSKFLFSALALSVVLSLFASYFVAMSVVPLFCANLIKSLEVAHGGEDASAAIPPRSAWGRFNHWFNARFHAFLQRFDRAQAMTLARPLATVLGIAGIFVLSLGLTRAMGLAYFPRTDPGQFVINLKAAPGTRVEVTEQEVAKVEAIVHRVVSAHDLRLVVSNIGSTPDLSSIYTTNSAPNTAYVQVSLVDEHKVGSYAYMDRVREALRRETPELATYFQSGGLVDAVLNQGIPAPIDIQVSSTNLDEANAIAEDLRRKAADLPGVSDAFIPQDIHAPSLQLNIDRYHAMEMGLSEHEVVNNVITALTSDGMIAPSYWVDPKSGNLYMLTVQYPENTVKSLADLKSIPVRSDLQKNTAMLDTVAGVKEIQKPTEVDHYQLRRVIDVYVAPRGEELSRVANQVDRLVADTKLPPNVVIRVRGIVGAMNSSFRSFGIGLILSVVLVYLILVAQFKSFIDPFIILLAVPPGITGVLIILTATGTTLNIMSLMGIVMMVGVVVSNSILIVEFTHRLIADGMALKEAVQFAARVRLRPILMTSLATVIGLIPMALALEPGSESYAPLARSIIGGMVMSVALTVFLVPAAFYLYYRRKPARLVAAILAAALLAHPAARAEDAAQPLSLADARTIALQNHPRYAAAQLQTFLAQEVLKETRANYYPTLNGFVTAAGATTEGTRILAGGLNNPSIYDRVAGGLNLNQLITDFGRTDNLTASAKAQARGAAAGAESTREQIILNAETSYLAALQAQAVLQVARQTVTSRNLVMDQVNALARSNLKSSLDVSFAQVAVEEADLLVQQAEGQQEGAMASLSAALGYRNERPFVLTDKPEPAIPLPDVQGLIESALRNRPDLLQLRAQRDAAKSTATAEKDANYPTLAAVGAAGNAPWHDSHLEANYAAGGVQLSIPIFAGGAYIAREREARLRADVADNALREAEDNTARDVRIAWVGVRTALQRLRTTDQLVQHATEAFNLAQARYKVGSSSVIELSEAQLSQTSAAIAQVTARYDTLIQKAVLDFQTGATK